MSNAEVKTKKTRANVADFLAAVPDEQKRKDSKQLLALFKEVTGEKPVMWGPSMVGFGEYHYKSPSGREGDWMITGFSPRVQNLTVYIMPGYSLTEYKVLLGKLGPHSLGKSCLYIKRLDDVDTKILKQLIKKGYSDMLKKYKKSKPKSP